MTEQQPYNPPQWAWRTIREDEINHLLHIKAAAQRLVEAKRYTSHHDLSRGAKGHTATEYRDALAGLKDAIK